MLNTKIKKLLYFILLSLTLLSLLRFALWILYSHDFSTLNGIETIQSFWMGVRIDLITLATPLALFILLFFLPFKFTHNKSYQNILLYIWYLILILIIFVILADMVYFQFVHRHVGSEITAIGNDTGLLLEMLFEYKVLILSFIALIFIVLILIRKISQIQRAKSPYSYLKEIGLFLLISILLLGSIRGKIQGKPFSISDAFVVNKTASGNLALNGCYTLYRTFKKGKKKKVYTFYSK